ncbi:MAG TPA: S-methyl-5-thioribose-1-phosphate isomerase, partial [Pseudomonadales bacterium]|nr:S-methyl-5-thioribose-1-phosphate isomerase [Pseudomonadales bacterium]
MIESNVKAIDWCNQHLKLLDQRVLPHEEAYVVCADASSVADAIREMVVRGAPAIGISAAYGVVLAAQIRYAEQGARWKQAIAADIDVLWHARPTAVNLHWALKRMQSIISGLADEMDPVAALQEEAVRIHQEDIAANYAMGQSGAEVIANWGKSGRHLLTHCNTGSLATGGYGTALGVIRSAYHRGLVDHVHADETRPWMQGARLTVWELMQDNIPVSLNADSAAAYLMQQGKISWVIVGADRITANGDTANKIGTYSLAVLARYHKVG